MRVKVKIRSEGSNAQKVEITTDFIKLDSFLKFASVTQTGGEAKLMIEDGAVKINGEICTQRGKKLHVGDYVNVDGTLFVVSDGANI